MGEAQQQQNHETSKHIRSLCLAPCSLTVRTLALSPGQPLLLPLTDFLILGVCGWQKGEQHENVKLLYSVCSPRPGTHKTQTPSGMDNSTHLKKIQYSPQAVQYGRSVSLRKGGERSMITRENIRGCSSQPVGFAEDRLLHGTSLSPFQLSMCLQSHSSDPPEPRL